jgi:hypothetical protein
LLKVTWSTNSRLGFDLRQVECEDVFQACVPMGTGEGDVYLPPVLQ